MKLVLGKLGIEYAKLFNFEYTRLNRNTGYVERLMYISRFAAFYLIVIRCPLPHLFQSKIKKRLRLQVEDIFGKMNINGIDYLIYYVPKKRDKRYMASVIYDMEKEREYKNFIVLTDDVQNVKMNDLAFGKNQVLVLEDNECNREKLKYLYSVDWARIVEDYYDNKVFLAEYYFCDYTDYEQKYVSTFCFLDAEKIYRIKSFLRENKDKNADIVCGVELEEDLRNEFPNARFVVVDLERYVDKERKYYE